MWRIYITREGVSHILFDRRGRLTTIQPPGINLELIFATLSHLNQSRIVAQVARFMTELFRHRFDTIGSLILDREEHRVGPIVRRSFCLDGRAKLALNRGPFTSARAYYNACAQRELDCARTLFVQDASPAYQHDLDDGRLQVERITGLFCDLVRKCDGLDDSDPAMAPFSLDIHQFGLKNFIVNPADPVQVVRDSSFAFHIF